LVNRQTGRLFWATNIKRVLKGAMTIRDVDLHKDIDSRDPVSESLTRAGKRKL